MEILLEINPSATQHNTTQHNTTQHNTTQHNTTQHNTTQHNTTVQQEDIRDYPRGTAAMQCDTTVLQRNFTRNYPKCNTMQCNTIGQREDFRDIPWRNKGNTTQHNSARRKLAWNFHYIRGWMY